jgi:hypothetical protein
MDEEIKKAREMLELSEEKFTDEQVRKIIEQTDILADIFLDICLSDEKSLENFPKKEVTLHTKILYNPNGDNLAKDVEELKPETE